MVLSERLKAISSLIENVKSIVDVGTDHGYIPIYLVENKLIDFAVASDINKGPVEKAKKNIQDYSLGNKIQTRLGGGLTTIKPGEVEAAVIAGMGGNLIRDILEDSKKVFKGLKYVVVQPVQNPEVLRAHIYSSGYTIIDEIIVKDEDKYYEIMKIKYDNNKREVDPIYYEVSELLLQKKDIVFKEYLQFKLNKYTRVYDNLTEETDLSKKRKEELETLIKKLKEFLQCF